MSELKRAGVRLTAEGAAQYKADLKSATAALAQMAAESKRNVAALGQSATASKRFGTAIKDLGNTAKLAQAKLDVLRDRQKQLGNASKQYASEIAKVENKMKTASGSTKEFESELANLRSKESLNNAELSRLNTTIAKTETQMLNAEHAAAQMAEAYRNAGGRFADSAEKLKTMGGRFDQIGDKAMNFGRTMTTHVTTPIVAGLGYAARAYMKFDDQMNQMRTQLDDGSISAGKLKQQVEQLGTSSQNMAKQYGIAGESIRNGMNELIKKGFTFNQVTGAMPSILKASVASGDDFNTVMNVSASTLEQFGLKVNDTNQMLKNTERVTSVLTFTANKTSAGFADLGEAMQNVGPMAANNNQSLEDMAATLGVLSNRGIEGGEAGTYLMNALMNLATPTKQQAAALDQLGVKTFDASGKMRAFPDILGDIEEATKGMSDEQKNAALSTIFNTQAMKGINPLIQAGSKSIKDLSASTKDASKYQDDLAKKMGESSSRNVAKMRESFKVLAETLGAQVVPAIIPVINKATELANKFGSLDSKTQGTIVKMAGLVAAIGPLSMTFGGVAKGIGGVLNGVGLLTQGFGRLTTSTGKVVEGAGKAGTSVSKFGGVASKVGGLAPLLSNPYVLAFGAIALGAAGLGMKIYKEMHADDNAHQAAVEATKGKYKDWFDTVVKGASDAEGANTKLQGSVKKTGETTEQMSQRLKRQNTETMNSINDSINGHTKVLNKATTDARGFYRMQTEEIEGLESKLKKLPSTTKAEVKQMTDAFKGMAVNIKGSYKDIMDASVKNKEITAQSALATINVTKDATSQIVQALNQKRDAELNDVKQMRENNLISQQEFEQQTQSITQGYQKRTQALQDSQNKITQVMSAAAREHRKLTADETVEITKAYLKMAEESGQAITKNGDAMKLLSQNMQQLISEEGVAALKHAGILSKTQAENVKNAKSSEEAIKIVKKAIEDYDKKEVKEKKLKAKDDVQVMDAKITSEINKAKTDIKSEIDKAKTDTDAKVKVELDKKETNFNSELQNAKVEFTNYFNDLTGRINNANNSIGGNASYLTQYLQTELDKNKKLFDESIDNAKKYTDSKIVDSQNKFNTQFNAEKEKMLRDINTSTNTKVNNATTILNDALERNKRELTDSFNTSVKSVTASLFTKLNTDLAAAQTEIESAKQLARNNNTLSSEEIQKINDKVDNMHVGAVNLLKDSKKERGSSEYLQLDFDLSPIFKAYPEDTKFTLSFDIKSEDISKQAKALAYMPAGEYTFDKSYNVPVTTNWTRQKIEGFIPKKSTYPNTKTPLGFYGVSGSGNKLTIKNIQLEVGTVATDYSPNIEDTKAEIKVVADSITAKAIEAVRGDIGYLRTNILRSNSITSNMISSGVITSDKLVSGSVTTDKLASNSVSADKILSNSITSDKIASSSITTSKLASYAITSDKIASNSITSDKLLVNSALINKLYADSLLSKKILADSAIVQSMMTNALTVVYASVDELRSRIINSDSVTANNLYVDRSLINKLFADNLMSNKIIGDYAIINTMKTKALEAVNANIGSLRTNILTSDSIKASMLDVDYAMINKLMTNSLLTNRLVADYSFINSLKAKALEAVYADIGNLRSKIITADSINASALNVDYALVNKLVSNYSFISTLTAQSAFIRNIKAIELDATRITGGVLQSQSGSMRWNLNGNDLDFYSSAKIIFHSLNNSLYYSNSGTCGFVKFSETTRTSYPSVVIGTSGNLDDDSNTGSFSGLKAHTAKATRDGYSQVNIIADRIYFDSHGGETDTGSWLLECYRKGNSTVRAFFGGYPTKYNYELGQSGNRFNTVWTEGINDKLKIYYYNDGAMGITGSNGRYGIKFNTGGADLIYDGASYSFRDILAGTSWRV